MAETYRQTGIYLRSLPVPIVAQVRPTESRGIPAPNDNAGNHPSVLAKNMNASPTAHRRRLPPVPGAARRELQSLLNEADWPGDVDSVLLAVHEALINSHRHGGGAVSAQVFLDGQDLFVEVCDQGPGFDVSRHASRPPEALAERGRGLWLISQIADSWNVRQDRGGTCFILRFRP